jgi:arylsulfatase A-like enzyme
VPGATHAPHHPTKEWIDKISAMKLFDQGWNKLREQIFANQKKLGVIPANAKLTPWPKDLPKWDQLSADEKKMFIRQADVFAAYTAYTDHEIGRVIQAVRGHGQARQHADHLHQRRQRHQLRRHPDRHAERGGDVQRRARGARSSTSSLLRHLGVGPTYPHMAVPWAWAFDTPFKWVKQVASHFGGTRQGMAISWPKAIIDKGGIRTSSTM